MKIPWSERLKIKNTPSLIKKYYKLYQVPCVESCIDFINRFCLTVDPRKLTDRVLPFELFEKQEAYVRWLWDRYQNQEEGVVDKCRGVGMSWMNAAVSVYFLLFKKSVTISMYTYKADECHKLGVIDTLIEKCIFLCKELPELFKKGMEHKLMSISCDQTGSIIIGKSGDSPGRGGRSTIFFLDECAHYPQAESIEAAVSRNADCKIWGSTHYGTNTLFYRKCTAGVSPVFTIDWWEIPLYNQKWYDAEKAKAEAEGTLHIFKMEVERDAAAAVEAVAVPSEWVNSAKRHDVIIKGKRIFAMDVADEGGDTNAGVCVDGNVPVYADEIGGADPGDATDKYFWKAVELNADEFRYDCIGVGAGAKVRIKEILAALPPEHKAHKIRIIPWAASSKVMRPDEYDFGDEGKSNTELFENAKSQAWWRVREQFRNTHRFINGDDHDETQIINIKEIEKTDKGKKLIREISQAQWKLSSAGRVQIDKKPKGTKSPNIAEAYIIARAEVDPGWLDWSVL